MPLRRLCEVVGVDPFGQSQRIRRQAELGATWAVTCITQATGADGKTYEMEVLPRRSIPLWAATMDLGRVAEEKRPMLARIQNEAAEVLADHFLGKRVTQDAMLLAMQQIQAQVAALTALREKNTNRKGAPIKYPTAEGVTPSDIRTLIARFPSFSEASRMSGLSHLILAGMRKGTLRIQQRHYDALRVASQQPMPPPRRVGRPPKVASPVT